MLMADPDHSIDDERYVLLGESTQRNLLVVALVASLALISRVRGGRTT